MTDSGTDRGTDGRTGVSKECAIAYMLLRAKNRQRRDHVRFPPLPLNCYAARFQNVHKFIAVCSIVHVYIWIYLLKVSIRVLLIRHRGVECAYEGEAIRFTLPLAGVDWVMERATGRGMNGVVFGQDAYTDLDFADDISLLAELLSKARAPARNAVTTEG